MGNIGDTFGTSLPAVGSSGPGYATSINAIMTEVMSRLSTKIPFSSLSLATSLDLNGQAILNAAYAQLLDTASAPGTSPVNRVTAFAGNMYWVGPSGSVQITNGAGLNAAAIGGITGDYGGANPAEFRYVAANTRYEAYHNFSTGTWANVRAQGFDISAAATGTVMAQLRYGGAGTLTFTLPPTLPAANAILGISSGGAITSNPSIATDITLTSGAVIKHGDRTKLFYPFNSFASAGSLSNGVTSDGPFRQTAAGTTAYIMLDGFEAGERIKVVDFRFIGTTGNITATLFAGGAGGSGSVSIPVTPSDVSGRRVLTVNTPYVLLADGGPVILKLVTVTTAHEIHAVRATYDRV